MGRSITPKYTARVTVQDGSFTVMWNGRATDARAEDYRKMMNKSYQAGGSNAHIRLKNGGIPHASKVEVRLNVINGCVVASATMPTFEAV